ncbi:hypothetical protein C0991_010729 [Blastosporella zonata]|nr:hypothetical protein C0991_010729 [Blastosporella zonata]
MSNRETELGTLIIVILKARNLNDKHSFYKQDVFAQVTFNGVTKRTKVAVKGGQHPEWDEEVRFPVMKQLVEKFRKLEVACFAKESRSDDILGKGEVDIADTLKTGEFDEWVPLNVDGVVRGDLYLEMTFFSNAPATTAPSRLLQSGPHSSELHPRHSPHQARLHSSLVLPVANPTTHTAALHNLLSDNPPASQQPLSNAYQPHHLQTSHGSVRSHSASPIRRADSPLPPLPFEEAATRPLPSTLLPGGGRLRPQQTLSPHLHDSPHVPSNLRAGPGRVVSQPIYNPTHVRQSSSESMGHMPRHDDYFSVPGSQTYGAGPPLPHTTITGNTPHGTSGQTLACYPPQSPAQPYSVVSPLSTQWSSEGMLGGPLSFPAPMPYAQAPGDYALSTQIPSSLQTAHVRPPPRSGHPAHLPESLPYRRTSQPDDYPDPYLQARYQTPLPLPPGSEGLSQVQSLPSLNPFVTSPDATRIQALRQIEEAAERRRAQEDKDLALALALDRELNLES